MDELWLSSHFFLTHSSLRTNHKDKQNLQIHGFSPSHHMLAVVTEQQMEG